MTALGNEILHLDFSTSLNRDHYHKQAEIVEWCTNQFGPNRSGIWEWNSAFGHTFFYFKNEKDYNWFILRWTSSD